MTTDTELQPTVAAELLALADVLDSLPDERWEEPSMCAGWRVREVVAHMTMAARYPQDAFMAELRDHNFDFGSLSDAVAARDADLPIADHLANLRSEVMQHWAPGIGGYRGALTHAVIHGLDITVPLGLPRTSPDDTIRVILDSLTADGGHEHFGTKIDGRSLQATDLDWSHGSGTPLRASAGDLALMLCGRAIPAERVTGEPLRG